MRALSRSLLLDQGRFIDDVHRLIENAEGISETDRYDIEYCVQEVCRFYNQSRDLEENPELAKLNAHHSEEELQLAVVVLLINLGSLASIYSFEFTVASYLRIVE